MRELSLHILDVVENSLEAGATKVEIRIRERLADNRISIQVTDNGRGMDAAVLARVTDPFYTTRTTRHVGLGIPLFKAAAERCNGHLTISSIPGKGTTVEAEFQRDHIDRAPLGDMVGTLLAVMLSTKACRLVYEHRVDERTFRFDMDELREALGGVPLTHPQVREWLGEYIVQGEAMVRTGPVTPSDAATVGV